MYQCLYFLIYQLYLLRSFFCRRCVLFVNPLQFATPWLCVDPDQYILLNYYRKFVSIMLAMTCCLSYIHAPIIPGRKPASSRVLESEESCTSFAEKSPRLIAANREISQATLVKCLYYGHLFFPLHYSAMRKLRRTSFSCWETKLVGIVWAGIT